LKALNKTEIDLELKHERKIWDDLKVPAEGTRKLRDETPKGELEELRLRNGKIKRLIQNL